MASDDNDDVGDGDALAHGCWRVFIRIGLECIHMEDEGGGCPWS